MFRTTRLAFLALTVFLPPTASFAAAPQRTPSYQRHVSALFSRLGCNGGTCHGAVQGQNGFRLSLFGADPDTDHFRLLRDLAGRRLDHQNPADSLLLKKATGQVPHQGGVRTSLTSFEYEVLRRWIAAGAPADSSTSSRVVELLVSPAEQVLRPGEKQRLRVEARFADGSSEDVTDYCSFESLDAAVAGIDSTGQIQAKSVGDAALIVRYRAQPALARVLVPRPAGKALTTFAAHNFIDAQVLNKLRRLNLPAAPLADDATFLRRLHLDVTGELPSAAEVRDFLASTSLDKRERKIDELLARPGHAALWTLKFCDILKGADFGVYADALTQEADAPRFSAWIRARLTENTPYDEFAERILLATGREGRSLDAYAEEVKGLFDGYGPGRKDLELYSRRRTLELYWQRRGSDGVGGAMQVAHAFLGLRLECAQCHRHPHDVWQQEDLLDFANFFMRVRRVGFEGQNEKRFADTAAVFKRYNDESKKLEAEAKKRRDTEGKNLDAELRKSRMQVDRLAKQPNMSKELESARAALAKLERSQAEISDLSRKAKALPEVARRLLQAEVRLLPAGTFAKVSSPIGTRESKTFRHLGDSSTVTPPTEGDPRELVMNWMRKPDNPFFARAIVNRVWAHYFGRGIIDPPDHLSPFNPPSHPDLLKDLCTGFVQSKYDLRWLHRTILLSRTYQQSSNASEESAADRANYASFPIRRHAAEVLLDALNTATGTTENMDMKYHHWPDSLRTVEIPFAPRNGFVTFVLETFGRPKRNAAVQCDCERDGGVSILQVLALANHPRVWEKIRDPQGRVARLLKEQTEDARRIEELFLATVSRTPTAKEREACKQFVSEAESVERGYQGVLWSLLNTREFVLQH